MVAIISQSQVRSYPAWVKSTSQPSLMENDETTTFQMETQVPDSTDQPPTIYLEDIDEEIDTRIENTTYTNTSLTFNF